MCHEPEATEDTVTHVRNRCITTQVKPPRSKVLLHGGLPLPCRAVRSIEQGKGEEVNDGEQRRNKRKHIVISKSGAEVLRCACDVSIEESSIVELDACHV